MFTRHLSGVHIGKTTSLDRAGTKEFSGPGGEGGDLQPYMEGTQGDDGGARYPNSVISSPGASVLGNQGRKASTTGSYSGLTS